MPLISESIIGEYPSQGFVEALISVRPGSSLRVCVRLERDRRAAMLRRADELLPGLIAEMAKVELAVCEATGCGSSSRVFDIWVEVDGSASYTCGFLDGEHEGDLFRVVKEAGQYHVQQRA